MCDCSAFARHSRHFQEGRSPVTDYTKRMGSGDAHLQRRLAAYALQSAARLLDVHEGQPQNLQRLCEQRAHHSVSISASHAVSCI